MLLSYFVHKTNIFSCHPVHGNQKGHHLFLMHGLDGTCGKHQERDIFFTSSAFSITCISISVSGGATQQWKFICLFGYPENKDF